MNREEIIDSTDELLKNALNIKKQVIDLDVEIKKNENKDELDKIKEERLFLYNNLSKINNENMGYKDIGNKLSFSEGTIKRLLDLCRLHIGRILFGMEDDFSNRVGL